MEPCGGIIPIWRAKVIESVNASLPWINPSRTVSRSKPSSSIGLPVGATPPKWPGPANVPVSRHCTPQRSPSAVVETTCMLRSGIAPTSSPMNSRTPSGASTSTWPRTFSRPPGRPHRRGASHVVRVDRLEVPPRDRLGLAAGRAFAPFRAAWRTFAATSCTFAAASLALSSSAIFRSLWRCCGRLSLVSLPVAEAIRAAIDRPEQDQPRSTKKPELGRGERVLPGVFRLRLPLPWPGVPHCNAWAVAAGDGVVLFDTGMHQPGSLAHLERAMQMCGLSIEDVRLVVCTHAHSDHYGQAATIVQRTGCELWMHPNHAHMKLGAEDPDAALERRLEVARQSGVPEEPLRRYAAERGDARIGDLRR